MTDFAPGDAVHIKGIGKGVVRESRNGGRYVVEVSGRSFVVTGDQMTRHHSPPAKRSNKTSVRRDVYDSPTDAVLSIDLHGMTTDEAFEAVAQFLDRALRTGAAEVRIIHGRSGGRLKAAVQSQLKRMTAIRGFALDPRNAGVTIVKL